MARESDMTFQMLNKWKKRESDSTKPACELKHDDQPEQDQRDEFRMLNKWKKRELDAIKQPSLTHEATEEKPLNPRLLATTMAGSAGADNNEEEKLRIIVEMEHERHNAITKRTSVYADGFESLLDVKKNLEDNEIDMLCALLPDSSAIIESDKALATIISQGSLSKTSSGALELATEHDDNRLQPNNKTGKKKTEKTTITDLRMKQRNEHRKLDLIKKVIEHGQFEPEAVSKLDKELFPERNVDHFTKTL